MVLYGVRDRHLVIYMYYLFYIYIYIYIYMYYLFYIYIYVCVLFICHVSYFYTFLNEYVYGRLRVEECL